jgi:hypothetical protein
VIIEIFGVYSTNSYNYALIIFGLFIVAFGYAITFYKKSYYSKQVILLTDMLFTPGLLVAVFGILALSGNEVLGFALVGLGTGAIVLDINVLFSYLNFKQLNCIKNLFSKHKNPPRPRTRKL